MKTYRIFHNPAVAPVRLRCDAMTARRTQCTKPASHIARIANRPSIFLCKTHASIARTRDWTLRLWRTTEPINAFWRSR